jgi:hypothetical protein
MKNYGGEKGLSEVDINRDAGILPGLSMEAFQEIK